MEALAAICGFLLGCVTMYYALKHGEHLSPEDFGQCVQIVLSEPKPAHENYQSHQHQMKVLVDEISEYCEHGKFESLSSEAQDIVRRSRGIMD